MRQHKIQWILIGLLLVIPMWNSSGFGFDLEPKAGNYWKWRIGSYQGTTTAYSYNKKLAGYTVLLVKAAPDAYDGGNYRANVPGLGYSEIGRDIHDALSGEYLGIEILHPIQPALGGMRYGDPVGKTAEWQGYQLPEGGEIWDLERMEKETWEILGYETVTVPYGTFTNAMKVKNSSYSAHDIYIANNEPAPGDEWYLLYANYEWYVPVVGMIKSQEIPQEGDPISDPVVLVDCKVNGKVDFNPGGSSSQKVTLTASIIGGHGTLLPASGSYNSATVVTLTATPDTGYRVKSWLGTDNDALTTTANTVSMNANKSVTVEFEEDGTNGSSWQLISNMMTARDQFAGCVIGDKIYVFGGNGNPDGFNLNSGEVYGITANSWSSIAPSTSDGIEELSGVGLNGKFYVFGGWGCFGINHSCGVVNFNERYDPASNTWTTLAQKPTTTASAVPAIYEGKIYLFGGYYEDENPSGQRIDYTKVEAYNPATNTWQYVTEMPKYLTCPAVAVYGNSAYVIGGYNPNAGAMNTEVMVYNFASNTWTRNYCVAPAEAGRAHSYASPTPVIDGKTYLIGGAEGTAANHWETDQVTVFDITAKTWSSLPKLPEPRSGHLTVVHDKTIYVIGGYADENDINGTKSSVYAFHRTVYQLTASVVGEHGTISTAGGSYDAGTVVNLTATADAGYWVKSWLGTDNDTLAGSGNTVTMNADKTVTVEFEEITDDVLAITSLAVKAGKTRASLLDSLILKGNISPEYLSFISDPANDLSDITISVFSEDTDQKYGLVNITLNHSFIKIDAKRSKISYKTPTITGQPAISFAADLAKGAFTLTGKNLNLTGLQSPVTVQLSIGDYSGHATVYDGQAAGSGGELDLINGVKSAPIQFMQGYANTLQVSQHAFTLGTKKPHTDKLTVQGFITTADADVNIANLDVTVKWGSYSVVLLADDLYQLGSKMSFKYTKSKGSNSPIAAALFDLEKCTFKIIVANAAIGDQGNPVDLEISFGSFTETVPVGNN